MDVLAVVKMHARVAVAGAVLHVMAADKVVEQVVLQLHLEHLVVVVVAQGHVNKIARLLVGNHAEKIVQLCVLTHAKHLVTMVVLIHVFQLVTLHVQQLALDNVMVQAQAFKNKGRK